MLKRIQEPEAWEPQINQAAFEALDMAIEALSQESSEDVISRQAAIDALARTAREKFNLSDEYNHYLAGLMDGELAIKELPPIQPELIEKTAYIRGFEQGRTQGMIDSQGGRNE